MPHGSQHRCRTTPRASLRRCQYALYEALAGAASALMSGRRLVLAYEVRGSEAPQRGRRAGVEPYTGTLCAAEGLCFCA